MNFLMIFLVAVIGGVIGFLYCTILSEGKEAERKHRLFFLEEENELLRRRIEHLIEFFGKLQRQTGDE